VKKKKSKKIDVEMLGKKWNHFITWLFKWNDELDRSVYLSSILSKTNYNYSHMGM